MKILTNKQYNDLCMQRERSRILAHYANKIDEMEKLLHALKFDIVELYTMLEPWYGNRKTKE